MRESELLSFIYERSRELHSTDGPVETGPGDDCAVLRTPGGDRLLLTVDHLIEGRHFVPGCAIDLIARKAIARSVSDIAAMAGRPSAALATALMPAAYPHADELFERMASWALHWGCPLVGGDIASHAREGPLSLTVTVLGVPPSGPVPLRSRALVGQDVYVTGALGWSGPTGRHLTFEPRLAEASSIASLTGDALGAMIDLSDGLGRDAARIGAASGVTLVLDAEDLPCREPGGDWRRAAGEGEDYELCVTTSATLPARCPTTGTPLTRIGRVEARAPEGSGCLVRTNGALIDASELGWDH